MADVALLRCDTYSPDVVKGRILKGLDLVGIDPGCFRTARVALKPNLLTAVPPESAVVTHPGFFEAVAQIVIDHGGKPLLVESPAVVSLKNALRKAGYLPIIDKLGIEIAHMDSVEKITYEHGHLFKYFEVSRALGDVDMIVNIPKLKTHGLTYLSAAVKNLFGIVPGMRKSQMHLRFPDKREFSEFILDLYGAVINRFDSPGAILHILDAVVSLEGEGPGTSGSPRKTGAVIISEDALALDSVAVDLVGLDMNLVATLTSGFTRDFGVSSRDEIHVLGERIEDMRIQGFLPTKNTGGPLLLRGSFLRRIMKNLFVEKPSPLEGACILCYQCRHICPAGAISEAKKGTKVPQFDYQRCIRCFCCQEICPEAAITIKKGRLQWLMGRRY
ncbi:MAG TPA: DUF362 domain-containing protein [Deltaproteobacteria bacterium]|nr:DUF362 domain-containing protein [Deltaproteobacteria bacterium]